VEGAPTAKELLDLLEGAPVTTVDVNKQSEAVTKLLTAISLHAVVHPDSKEVFIRRGLELARSPDVNTRLRAFVLLASWIGEDPRIDKAIDDMEIPRSAL
jgi:hypothetical protein